MAGKPPPDFHEHRQWSMPIEGARRAAVERFQGPPRWPSWMLDTARHREQPAMPGGIDALAEITLPDQDGKSVRLRDLWRDGPAVVVWLRQFGCPFCRAYAKELNRARSRFEDAGARLVLIGQGTPEDARRFRRHLGIDLQVLTDADRVTYLWAGTKIATLDELIGPVVVGRALVRMARQRVFIGHNTADEAQLGGSIVVTTTGRVTFAHISSDASDVAPPAKLLSVLPAMGERVRRPTHGQAATVDGSATGLKAGVVAALVLMGAAILPAPAAIAAAGPSGLPLGDPGQPTYLDVQGAAPVSTDRTIANWHGQFTDPTNGVTYGYNMVGGDPAAGGDVTIPVDLIPIDVTFSTQGVALRGSDIVARTLASPIFSPANWSSAPTVTSAADAAGNVQVVSGGELSAGNTGVGYLDALLRSQFNKVGTTYHARLGSPTVLSPWKLDCSKAGGSAYVNPRGVVYGRCNNFPFDVPWGQWRLDPTHLVIFLSHNIEIGSRFCCALGWHTAYRLAGYGRGQSAANGSQELQTWMVTTYLDQGLYNPAIAPFVSDLTVLSHEIAEWADDPFATNLVQPWYSPLPPQDGCGSVLENGDPVDRIEYSLPGNTFDTGPYADGRWHLQDIAFLPWYARESPNLTSQATQTASAAGGRYTFMGDLNPYAYFHQPATGC